MKKILSFGLAAFMLLGLVASCADPLMPVVIEEEQKQQPEAPKTVSFQATLEQVVDETKTALGSDLSVVWSMYDAIRVYSASCPEGEIFTLRNEDAGKKTGTFTGSASIGDGPYYAVYPATAVAGISNNYSTFYDSHSFSAGIQPLQSYEANSFGIGSNVSWSYSTTLDNLFFHNVFGAVKFTLKGTATIKLINLYTRGSELLSGTLKVEHLDGEATSSLTGTKDEMHQYLYISCGDEGVQLNETTGIDFFISVPTGALADGFFVEIIDAAGGAMIKSAKGSSANVIHRSKIRKMGEISYSPQYRKEFLREVEDFAAYSGVAYTTSEAVKQCTYTEGVSQYAFLNTAGSPGSRDVRFQDWNVGYSLALHIASKTLTHNSTQTVNVTAQGKTYKSDDPDGPGKIVSRDNVSMKVIKQTVERAWLYDSGNNQGYVIKLED